MHFGIGVDEALTLDEIGMRFEVTRERIRQIEAKALKKLRHPGRSEAFARMALGLQPEENPLAQSVPEPEGDDAPDTAEPIPQPAKPKAASGASAATRARTAGRLVEAFLSRPAPREGP